MGPRPRLLPPNYAPNKEEEDTPLLIDNLVNPPENAPKEEKGEKNDAEEAEDEEEDRRTMLALLDVENV